MSTPSDPKKPKGPPPMPATQKGSAGRSASARSIGEELGGLDFEPDALLDSLLSEQPAPSKPPEPTPASTEPAPAISEQLEAQPFPAEETTLARRVEPRAPEPPAPPGTDEVDALFGSEPALPPEPPRQAPPRPQRPAPPRPGAPPRPAPPRPFPPAPAAPTLGAPPDHRLQLTTLDIEPETEEMKPVDHPGAEAPAPEIVQPEAPEPAPVLEPLAEAAPLAAEHDNVATLVPEQRPSGGLDALIGSFEPVAPARSMADEVADDGLGTIVDEAPEAGGDPGWAAAGDWESERAAVSHLTERGELGAHLARAGWLEAEAAHTEDVPARARMLLVASELWAMAGKTDRARQACAQAVSLAPASPLAGRQARLLAAADKAWNEALGGLDAEAKSAPSPELHAHALYVGAEVARLATRDPAGAERRLDAMSKGAPADIRPHLAKLGTQLGTSNKPPKLALPADAPELEPLADAVADLAHLRGDEIPREHSKLVAIPFEDTRRGLDAGDRAAAGRALARLSSLEGFENAARWLAAALLSPARETRPRAIELLAALAEETGSAAARRALAARALEQGDPEAVAAAVGALEQAQSSGFTAADMVALGALTGGGREALLPWLEPLLGDADLGPLAAAATSTASRADSALEIGCGPDVQRTEVALGRAMLASSSTEADPSALRSAYEAFSTTHPSHPLAHALELELGVRAESPLRVAEALDAWSGDDDDSVRQRNRHLAAGLAYELAKDRERAVREYAAALRAEPSTEAATRALLETSAPEAAPELLTALADACQDPAQKSLLFTEVALRLGSEADTYVQMLERAAEAAPKLPFAFRLGKHHASIHGNETELLGWLRGRRDHSEDVIERALDGIREALLTADTDSSGALALLSEAAEARPDDAGVHELRERLSGEPGAHRGSWRERLAEKAEGANKGRLLLAAALEYERAGDREAAARVADSALAAGDSGLARITAERLADQGGLAAKLSEQLLAQAKASEDPTERTELYSRLSALDAVRGDASALLWQSAILDDDPKSLAALDRLENAYVGGARVEELGPIAEKLARALEGEESAAHALLAARLHANSGNRDGVRAMAEIGAAQVPPALWALRTLSAVARESQDDQLALEIDRQLSERAERAVDAATLALRAAEAAGRLGKHEQARQLLERVLELVPEHLVALEQQADILEASGNPAAAAETLEQLARQSGVDEHRIAHWYRAALLWLDKTDNAARGQAALEQVAELDLRHADVFERLRAAFVAAEERSKLAELLERRLELTEDPQERIALEVTRGRALAEIGDSAAAKEALAAALDANPDHVDALDAFAEICVAEGDWEGAEQSWIRLARHATEPDRQAEMYRKLGRLYEQQMPNGQRAELAYREVLKRLPNDTGAMERLVFVYGSLGDKQKALELQMDLLNRAGTPEEKRDRTIQLAFAQEKILGDRRKAEGTLDKARKTWPQDGVVLRALAEFYRRGNETPALNVLLDRAANDARRALSTGRFDAALFESLATVAELRGGTDAANVAKATLAALHGEDAALPGAELSAGDAKLDDLLAPELLSLPLRALLRKAAFALDAAYTLDLRAIRAAPLPAEASALATELSQMAAAFGLRAVEFLVSSALGPTCTPVSSNPPRLVLGSALLDKSIDEGARRFLILRSLKIIQANAATLSRTAPIELWPTVAAFLSVFASNWQPQGVDAKKFAEGRERIRAALTTRVDDDVPVLALEVIGAIGNRASQLGTAVNQWGNRTALLAIGSPTIALSGVALASGHGEGPPADHVERLKWIVRNPEARDLAVFSVSEQYSEARSRLGVGS